MPLDTPAPVHSRHKLLFGVTIGILLYAAFNLWVWHWSNSGKASSPTALRQTIKPSGESVTRLNPTEFASSVISLSSPGIPANARIQSTTTSPLTPPSSSIPRTTGQGNYACSLEGVCNVYSDEARKQYCTTTFADNRCLDQCGNESKRCTK